MAGEKNDKCDKVCDAELATCKKRCAEGVKVVDTVPKNSYWWLRWVFILGVSMWLATAYKLWNEQRAEHPLQRFRRAAYENLAIRRKKRKKRRKRV